MLSSPDADDAQWSIGRLATLSGLPVKTVRFYSDGGLLPPQRASSGHRRYGRADLARLNLIRSLRALDVALDRIREMLAGVTDLRDCLSAHEAVLEIRLRSVRRQLAVCRAASTAPDDRTVDRLQALVRIEAAERDQLLDRFWDRVLAPQIDAATAARFRTFGTPELPEEPTGEQVDAWLELAELAANEEFQETTRRNASWFWVHLRPGVDLGSWQQQIGAVMTEAVPLAEARTPARAPNAAAVIDRYVAIYAGAMGRSVDDEFRGWLAQRLAEADDPRAARWWELVGVITPPDPGVAAGNRALADAVRWMHAGMDTAAG